MKEITVEAVIHAKTDKVWEYYTLPKHITKWNFASDDWHCPNAKNDLKPGGTFSWRMEAKDGSFGFDLEGTFNNIILLKEINYTLNDGRKVTTTFKNADNTTKVTTVFEAETVNPVDLQQQGWQAILNNFKNYTEDN